MMFVFFFLKQNSFETFHRNFQPQVSWKEISWSGNQSCLIKKNYWKSVKKKLIAGTGDKLIGNRKWFIDLCTGWYEYVIDVFSLRLTRLSSILIYMESLNDLNNKLQWRLDTELTSSVRQLSFESLITTLFLLV